MSQAAAAVFNEAITGSREPCVALATGYSPLGLYRNLVASQRAYHHLRVVKLDEWLGLPMDHPSTCEYYLQKEFLGPLGIRPEHYLAFESQPAVEDQECARISGRLANMPVIDLCVLGLGKNGHLGLNEPGARLYPDCHVISLEASSMQHKMLKKSGVTVTKGITLGMANILRSKKIILLVTGDGKQAAFDELKKARITTGLPASFLWLHPEVHILADRESVK
jgi:galactosamine-6-phosphate isomerase